MQFSSPKISENFSNHRQKKHALEMPKNEDVCHIPSKQRRIEVPDNLCLRCETHEERVRTSCGPKVGPHMRNTFV